MRRLTKHPEPQVLQQNGAAWTAEYVAAAAAGQKPLPTRWRHGEVVAALEGETLSKCAYCEAIILHVAHPHVEHIVPKAVRPDLVVEWRNLTVGCPQCNTNKGDYYDQAAPVIHPYDDDVSGHISFRGPMVVPVLGSDLGRRSISRLKLHRSPLIIERAKRIQALHLLLEQWARSDGPDKDVFADLVKDALADDQEYVTALRLYAASFGFAYP